VSNTYRQAGYTVDTTAVSITALASTYSAGNLAHTARETGSLLNDLRFRRLTAAVMPSSS
jgi:hypothetical protein